MRTGKCAICGEEFQYIKGKKLCCSPKCARERNRLLNSWRLKAKTQEKNKNKSAKKVVKRKKVLSIAEINELARAQGMSYGEYLARTEGGMR